MIDILAYLPAKRKQSSSGWLSFNAPCCIHNGESADRRQRGGIKVNDQGWSFHCFNCGFTASFILGKNLSFKSRKLLSWLNVPQEEIERINLESLRHRNVMGILDDRQRVANVIQGIEFEEKDLPPHVDFLEEASEHWQYLKNRAAPMDYPYMTEGNSRHVGPGQPRKAIIIPFTHNGKIVGYTKRFLDDRTPKYIQDIPPGYVFGTDLQKSDWQHVLVMEGVFDALTVSGLAVLHAEINDAQVRLIRNLGREVTVVPDQDSAGMKLVDRAIELGWAVSMPEWPDGCKDVNDAVKLFGKLGTLLTIMQARETSRIKIELKKKQLTKKFTN